MYDSMALFTGALLDALIGPNLFVPGEPFLIAAGFQLHQGIWTGVIAVLFGGLLGDQLSYWIGRRFGRRAQSWLMQWQPKTRRPIARCRLLLQRKGNAVLVFARLLGPVAWIVPFIAGVNRIKWDRFSLFSTVGLLLGVSQIVLWGYLLAYGIETFPWMESLKIFIDEHLQSLLVASLVTVFIVIGYKYQWKRLVLKSIGLVIIGVSYLNYSHFFWLADDISEKLDSTPIVFELSETSFKVFPGVSSIFDAQAMNIVLIGESPVTLMNNLGWIQNKTFSRNDIDIKKYFTLMKGNTPPVSDLFWQGRTQDLAFQLPGYLLKRSHIRWWYAGQKKNENVWLGALSYDDGLTITPYRGIVTLLHSVDPDVDKERARFEKSIQTNVSDLVVMKQKISAPIVEDDLHEYFTDGNILIISKVILLSLTAIETQAVSDKIERN